jgi:hypothetical protein
VTSFASFSGKTVESAGAGTPFPALATVAALRSLFNQFSANGHNERSRQKYWPAIFSLRSGVLLWLFWGVADKCRRPGEFVVQGREASSKNYRGFFLPDRANK